MVSKIQRGWVMINPNGSVAWWTFAKTAEAVVHKVTKSYPMRPDPKMKPNSDWQERERRGYTLHRAMMTLTYEQ